MIPYSVIMFLVGLLFAGVSIAIYKGKTDLIHDYHRTKVKDHAAYGKAFGKAMMIISASLLLGGAVGLLGDSDWVVWTSLGVLFAGLIVGFACIGAVQKKYNNGIF